MKKQLDLVTCSFSAYKPDMGVPVCISVGKPKWFKYPYEFVKVLAPFGIFNNPVMKAAGRGARHAAYLERLETNQIDLFADLYELSLKYPNTPLVLMCYENVHKGDVCHRRWAADWLLEHHGLIVPEVSPKPKNSRNMFGEIDQPTPPLTLF